MSVKFKITGERFAEACSIFEYLQASNGSKDVFVRIAPRFVVDENGEYIVKVNYDDDGDPVAYEGLDAAFMKMASITPKRLEKLGKEFSEAARSIVNPPNGGA